MEGSSARGGVFVSESQVANWGVFLGRLKAQLSSESYDTWVKPLVPVHWDENRLVLSAPTRYIKEWVESHYGRELSDSAREIQPDTKFIQIVVAQSASHNGPPSLGNLLGDFDAPRAAARPKPAREAETSRTTLLYSLDSFVVGPSNRLAFASCKAVCDAPATLYNPLVIQAPSGLGKTHLLRGVAHLLQTRHSEMRVRSISCEEFANTYLQAMAEKRLDGFRNEIRRCHALLVDDIQFLVGKEKTQEEFLHTFDALRHLGRQIVLSINCHPRELKRLDERLIARLLSGLLVAVTPMDVATRAEVIQSKAKARGLALDKTLAELVSVRVDKHVQELEGLVCKLFALSSAAGKQPDRELVLQALREQGYLREGPLALEEILEAVSRRTGISADDMRAGKRHSDLVRARHIAIYLARHLTEKNISELGRFFGNRNHATVLHALEKIETQLTVDARLREDIAALRRLLGR